MKKLPIFVAKPSLPDLEDLIPYLEKIWKNKIVTNNGPFHKDFEDALGKYIGAPYVSLTTNAIIGLMIALKALNIKDEVITTPFSYVASAHSLIWNNLKPVFVDIDENTLNIDPKKIESAITSKTTAIMAVHVYGNPCEVDVIEHIAKKHNLKVIYDAAHAFGVQCHCGSILNHGDISVLSFHATKVFNTFEGGAVICKNKVTKNKIDSLKSFGLTEEGTINQVGINGKMNEFTSALGLLQLKRIDNDIKKRKTVDAIYRKGLKNIKGIRCHKYSNMKKGNYSYFPIFVENDYPLTRDQLYEMLMKNGINVRRYFYPLITDFFIYKDNASNQIKNLSTAKRAADSVLCLPIYSEISSNDIEFVLNKIRSN